MFRNNKVQFDILVAFLMWLSDPLPLRIMQSESKSDNINLSVDNGSKEHQDFGIYDLNSQYVNMISNNWASRVNEFYNKGKIYYDFIEANPELEASKSNWFPEVEISRGYVFDGTWDG